MRVVHPKTGAVLLMVDSSPLIAEVETEVDAEDMPYRTVTIGNIGYSSPAMMLYRDEWEGFMALVKQIDLEFRHDMNPIGELKP
jgi:hypothetical protein